MNLRELTVAASLIAATCHPVLAATAQQPTPPLSSAPKVMDRNGPAGIVAVVNGDVISRADVDNRRRLFALSTGQSMSQDVLDRLTPQVIQQLIEERLRLQEIQRRKISVSDADIATAVTEVEGRNGMPPGLLRRKLSEDGVGFRTLVDQIRVQIGWSRVLRQVAAGNLEVSEADIADQERIQKALVGQPEYRVGEIFIPVKVASQAPEAQRFADTVIQQLRAGAPFAVVAAQFSQSQTALQGGDLGWVDKNRLDPAVLRVVQEMPAGAISNPIRVPGGFTIVTLRAKREIGRDPATMLKVRQVFFPFATKLDPNAPTEQQKKSLAEAKRLSETAHGCDAMEAAAKTTGSDKPADPGDIRLEGVSVPALRAVLTSLSNTPEKASQPLVAEDGIAVVMVCSKEEKNLGVSTHAELAEKLVNQRVELASRQLQRELDRKAVIDQRS